MPTVLVSPLIAKGTVFRVPVGATPLDHTSILKTVEQRWKLPALTARDGAAVDVGGVLTLTTARTDDPLSGMKVPKAQVADPARVPMSHLEEVYVELASQLPVKDWTVTAQSVSALQTSADAQAYIDARIAAWQASGHPG